MNGQIIQVKTGTHRNRILQEEWNAYGKDAFVFEVLEVLKEKNGDRSDIRDQLRKIEQKWLDHIQPFGERGYHLPNKN